MDRIVIKSMLSNKENTKISETPDSVLKDVLVASILKAFTLSGIVRGYDPEQLKNDIALISEELLGDLRRESIFFYLRPVEVGYCFLCGLRGDFDGLVKTFGINYQAFYKWLAFYASSGERQEAINYLRRADDNKMLVEKNDLTAQEKDLIIKKHINEAYDTYRADGTLYDLGGVKERYLRELNLKGTEELSVYFNKCIEQKLTKIFEL